MKTPVLAACTLLAGAAFASTARADGLYVSVGAGIGLVDDASISVPPSSADLEMSMSTNVEAAVGWMARINPDLGWRAEGAFSFQYSEVDEISQSGSVQPGVTDSYTLALSVNGYLDWFFAPDWSAYVGAGVGYERAYAYLFGDFGFRAQVMLGAAWHIRPNVALFGEYRYVTHFGDLEGSYLGQTYEFEIGDSHNLLLGVRVNT